MKSLPSIAEVCGVLQLLHLTATHTHTHTRLATLQPSNIIDGLHTNILRYYSNKSLLFHFVIISTYGNHDTLMSNDTTQNNNNIECKHYGPR